MASTRLCSSRPPAPRRRGTYLTSTSVPASKLTGPGADWYRRYKERFQIDPFGYAPNACEAMNVPLAAIERVGKKDRAAIRDAIFATHDYEGIFGPWSFDANGVTTLTSMSIIQVKNGRWDEASAQIVHAPPYRRRARGIGTVFDACRLDTQTSVCETVSAVP